MGDEALQEPPAFRKVPIGLVLQPGSSRAAVVEVHRGRDGRDMAEERVHQRHPLVHDHVYHSHDPSCVQQRLFGRPPPKRVRNSQVRVVLRPDDVKERMVQDRGYGVVRELLLQPGCEVVPVHFELIYLALVELDRVVPVTHGNPVLGLEEIRDDLGVHRVMPPRLLQVVAGTIGNVFSHLAPHPAQMDARVPDPRLAGSGGSKLVPGQRRGLGVQLHLSTASRRIGWTPNASWHTEEAVLPAVGLLQHLEAPEESLLPLRGCIVGGVHRLDV